MMEIKRKNIDRRRETQDRKKRKRKKNSGIKGS